MSDLRRYDPSDIVVGANELRDKFDAGILNPVEFALAVNDFRFRDEGGDYWFLDARTNHWYRFDQGRWQASSTEPKSPEGPAWPRLNMTTSPEETEEGFEPLFEDQDPQTWTPTKALEAMVQTTRLAYERGRMSSDHVEEFLVGQYVIDEEGRFWTVGVRSGHWYYFESGQWRMAEQPPGLDSLLRLEVGPQKCAACGQVVEEGDACPQCGAPVVPKLSGDLEQAYAAALEFILSGVGLIPEQVTDPWDPPPGFPEAVAEPGIPCASCGATNQAGSRFCNQCGAALISEPPPASLICPECGNQVALGKKFCTQCGALLG